MTPKEKAKDLVSNFRGIEMPASCDRASIGNAAGKEVALICANEIITALEYAYGSQKYMWKEGETGHYNYWVSVRNEINAI